MMRSVVGATAVAACAVVACILGTSGCSDLTRDNPFDPVHGGAVDLGQLLVGAWSRVDTEKNEVYTFRRDRSVVLNDYRPGPAADSAGVSLATLDRNAPYPQVIVTIYSGTYTLVGDQLSMTFTDAISTDPTASPPSLPATPQVVSIVIRDDTLTMNALDGQRTYHRFK